MNTINQTKANVSSYAKLNQDETDIITQAPSKTVSTEDSIEMLANGESVNPPLIKNSGPHCSSLLDWMCFWNNPVENKCVHPSAVYQPTTTTIG
jgi:hypothetical protein